MKQFESGLTSISFRELSPADIIRLCEENRLSCIEWGSDVHAPKDDIENLQKIVRLQEKSGIKCSSYGTYFRLGESDINELPGYIKAAKILGTDILRVWCGKKGSKEYNSDPAAKDALFAQCAKAAEIAKEHQVTLCMECHNWTYTDTKETALELMNTINSPHFRMYWQPNQFCSFEENISYAKLLSPYTVNIHVFNWNGEEKYPLKDAIATWEKYLSEFDGSKVLLLEFMPQNLVEELPDEASALKNIIEGE